MTVFIVVVHVIVSLALIAMILLHAGRGGGVSDMFGGGFAPQSLGGSTVVERNLDRLTVIIGVVFAITTMLLAWLLG
jgi:preprotein translocase subunit SecG